MMHRCPHCKTPVSKGVITEVVMYAVPIGQLGNETFRQNPMEDLDHNFGKERYHCSRCDNSFKELEIYNKPRRK